MDSMLIGKILACVPLTTEEILLSNDEIDCYLWLQGETEIDYLETRPNTRLKLRLASFDRRRSGRTYGPTDGPTDRPTDRPMDGRKDGQTLL